MIRTRFAPSPTGFAHVGNIRTALFAFLVAKHGDGKFILRLEDTDKNREVTGSDSYILNAVKTLEINYDEGPDNGGPFAPYRQSERLETYKRWAEKLIESDRAYADPYTPEEIQKFREEAQATKKPFLYRNHRPKNPPKWDGSQPLRFKSDPKDYTWDDAVMGELHAGAEAIDDFVLVKSDGYPTYNFAHIVDDAEMEITHVIRGQEFISSTPNYLNLYEALKIDRPILASVPHIMNETGNKKLGKRDGAKDVMEYINEGFLVEAIDNFIASMGWNDGTEQEVFSMDELISKFDLDRVGRSGARFDEKRLIWLNGQWMKKLEISDLSERAKSFWGENGQNASSERQLEILTIVRDRLKTLSDLPALSEYFFERPTPDWSMIENNKQLSKLSKDQLINLLKIVAARLKTSDWSGDNIQDLLNNLLEETNTKPVQLFSIIRFALTWAPFSPGLVEIAMLLGKDETIYRINFAIENA